MKKFMTFLLVFLFSSISANSADMRFVQVDGLYYSAASEKSVEQFKNMIKDINKQEKIDFVVFSGNNIAKPNKENLKGFLKTAKKLNAPYYVVLGQKDVNRQKEMSKKAYVELVSKKNWTHKMIKSPNYTFTKHGVLFIVADGSKDVIPSATGYYRPDVLEWINTELKKNKNKNVIIIQHYPLIPPSKRETHYTYKAEDYLKLLSEHKNVKAIFAGHFGVNNEQKVDGILHVSTAEAPKYRVVDIVDCNSDNPEIWSVIKE